MYTHLQRLYLKPHEHNLQVEIVTNLHYKTK